MSAIPLEGRPPPLRADTARPWPRTEDLPPWPDAPPLLSIRDLRVWFDEGGRLVPALRGVDLEIHRGEVLGLVGGPGCGKSVMGMAVLGLLGPRALLSGDIVLDDTSLTTTSQQSMSQIRGKRIAMTFQNPMASLSPVRRIGSQVMGAIRLHQGLRGAAARAEAIRLLDRVRVPDAAGHMRAYPHELSHGTNQRVAMAMALAGEPDLLVADDPDTGPDTRIRASVIALLREIHDDNGMALALISRDLEAIADLADHVMVMHAGRIVERAPSSVIARRPRHPYTQDLVAPLSGPADRRRRIMPIPGTATGGCSFAPGCPHAATACHSGAAPTLRRAALDHHVACHRKD